MPKSEAGPLLRFIRALHVAGAGPEDAALLERFARQRDDAAFELLMWRHAAMVLRVCQDVLHDAFEAEDAFQAAFLVLARKAGSISKRESVSGWLYRVALRIALKARRKKALRNAREQGGMDHLAEQVSSAATEAELPFEWRPVLHEEIARLPAKYQTPMVLCYLEGRTHEQAALELGWAKGTVAGRLARARDLLRRRLTRRGLAPSAGLGLTFLAPSVSAAVPAALAQNTCKAALAFAAGKTAGLSPQVALWAEGAVKTMLIAKMKSVVFVFVTLALVGTGTGAVISGVGETSFPDVEKRPVLRGRNGSKAPAAGAVAGNQKPMRVEVATQVDGIVQIVGTEVKTGEPDRLVRLKVGTETRSYETLREGDTVKTGQLLVKLDDRWARNELEIKKARVLIAKAEADIAERILAEAKARHDVAEKVFKRKPPLISAEEYREKKLARDRFQTELAAKGAQILVAEAELRSAQMILDMHEVRSPVNGFVRSIFFRPGQAVKALDPLVEVVAGRDPRSEPIPRR